MRISNQASAIAPSPTLALNELAKNLQSQGKPVINLGVGEPANLTPMDAVKKASARLETRKIKYTPSSGTQDLKRGIIQYTLENYGLTPLEKNILVTVGAKQAIYNALLTILNPGDDVILLAPYWVSYPEMVKMVGGRPVVVAPHTGTLTHRLTDIQNAISPRTKAIIFNSPNNPSGVIYPPSFVADLVALCEKNEIYLIMDDIYHKLVYGNTPWTPGYEVSSKGIDSSHIIVINGISKSYGMTGFRIGWALASQELIKVMTNIQSQTTSGASILLQDAALGAITGDQDVVKHLCETIKKNREVTLEGLETISRVSLTQPEGAFYCLPDFSAYNPDSMALSRYILENALVAVVPGYAFGMEGHLRISYAGDAEDISAAIERIKQLLE